VTRRRGFAIALLIATNLLICGVAWLFHLSVAPGWKKGPLIDPASPYAPENAMVLFAVAACGVVDLYAVGLALLRPRGRLAPVVLLLAAMGVIEVGLRGWLAVDMVTYFRPDPVLQWVVRPNLHDFDNLTGGGRITTNADGMRDVTVPREKPAGEFRVLTLGDSSNFGHGVEGAETWQAVLQKLLAGRTSRPVVVLNGATPGWSTVEGLEFLRGTGLAYHPDLVIAGFNNDPGPEYLPDAARVVPPGPMRALQRILFRSELYLLSREVTLSLARRGAAGAYTLRRAGEAPTYGKLEGEEAQGLVQRVPIEEFEANVRAMAALSPDFAWLNMPINRTEPDLVSRYVDPAYRARALSWTSFPVVDVDGRWSRTRERDLFQAAHVFHPNPTGHARIAQQVAVELAAHFPGLTEPPPVEGPPAAPTEATVRFGWSSLTPVHAHVGVVLEAHPELAAQHGIDLALSDYTSGKAQGDAVASGALDAFFTCEVPAIQMLRSRPDVRIVATPGVLGRIALVARRGTGTLADLRGRRVGVAAGSTPAMDWATWSSGLGAVTVDLPNDALFPALRRGEVDAVVAWDPWVEAALEEGGLVVVTERRFRSVLAVSVPWAMRDPGRAQRLVDLVTDALLHAAADRADTDAAVAARSGWPLSVVRAVADQNEVLAGASRSLALGPADLTGLDRAGLFARAGVGARALVWTDLLRGLPPPVAGRPPPGSGLTGQR
jgi:ABC-type nitrate/sulfonate/bicarbonate transport system substrate-binding protein/lysophospholipase L1-like esterase